MNSAAPPASAWLVLVRDFTLLTPIDGQDATFVALVVDLASGQFRGFGVGPTAAAARVAALSTAADSPVPPFTPGQPALVVCATGDGDAVRADVDAALPGTGVPVEETELSPGIEELLDDVADHFGPPRGPVDEPSADQWRELVGQTLAFARAQPWLAWPDDLQLRLTLQVGSDSASYVAAVIGREGLQTGLVLYPGRNHSDVIVPDEWEPDDPLPFRDGSLLLHLNPPDDTVEDMARVAVEHGWPADASSMPVWISAGPGGFEDLEKIQAVRLALALVAVLARLRRPLDRKASRVTGTLTVAEVGECRYAVADLPRAGLA
jgi:hypothetical protein